MNVSVPGGCEPPEPPKPKPPTDAERRRNIIAGRLEALLGKVILEAEHHSTLLKVLNLMRGPLVPEENLGSEIIDAIRTAATKVREGYDRQTVHMALVEVQVIVNYFARNRSLWP